MSVILLLTVSEEEVVDFGAIFYPSVLLDKVKEKKLVESRKCSFSLGVINSILLELFVNSSAIQSSSIEQLHLN